MLQALADAAGVLVVASYDVQWGPSRRGFEGRIRYYRPVRYFRRDGLDPRTTPIGPRVGNFSRHTFC
jgi:hypothetical protein